MREPGRSKPHARETHARRRRCTAPTCVKEILPTYRRVSSSSSGGFRLMSREASAQYRADYTQRGVTLSVLGLPPPDGACVTRRTRRGDVDTWFSTGTNITGIAEYMSSSTGVVVAILAYKVREINYPSRYRRAPRQEIQSRDPEIPGFTRCNPGIAGLNIFK